MLNNKKNIYNLCFGLSKLYINIQQDQKANLNDHMSRFLRIWRAGRGRGVRRFKMFCQRGSEFFLFALYVCVCGGGVKFSIYPSVRKITDAPPIDK